MQPLSRVFVGKPDLYHALPGLPDPAAARKWQHYTRAVGRRGDRFAQWKLSEAQCARGIQLSPHELL